MDSDLLSQLLFRAKKENMCVQLFPAIDNHGWIVIDPKKNWDIRSDSLVVDNGIIDLNNIVSAVLIHYQKYYQLTNHITEIENK